MKETSNFSEFSCDFFRMTGVKYSGTLKNWLQILLHHNLRYMWWWRKKDKTFWKKLSRLQLYRYSRKYGLEIGNAQIGRGLYLGHPYNITVNEEAVIGENVNLHKGVTIGRENRGKRLGAPIIGNNVFIGINATVVGHITVGNDVLIAPNSYVNIDIPDHSVVIGNPAKIIPQSGDKATRGYVNFCVE